MEKNHSISNNNNNNNNSSQFTQISTITFI